MAGRKPRLYDTVNKQWVDFKSLQEADALFKDKERNPFVTTKDYGITSRYRYDEPVNNIELATIAAGGKPKSLESAAAKTYKELNPDVDLAAGQNAVGINPVWDRDYNFRRHPEWRPEKPIYYPQYNEYWGYDDEGQYTNDIPENVIGSSERRALQAESKDEDEERKKWLSEYFNFLEGGFDAMSPEAQESYNNFYAEKNAEALKNIQGYDPKSPHVVKGRALTSIAGKNALEPFLKAMNYPEDNAAWNLSGMSNTDLAKLSSQNEGVAELFDDMMNYYMLKYYGDVAKEYKDDPINIGQDIEKNGDYAKIKESLPQEISRMQEGQPWWKKAGLGLFGIAASLGNSMVNNLGVQLKNTFDSDEIENQQRERANAVVNTLSDRLVNKNIEGFKGDTDKAAEDFDKLASQLYSYYKEHSLDDEDVYSKEDKRNLLMKYQIQASVIGEELANQNLLKELQNKDYDEQGTIKRLGYTANNLFNTVGTTVGHIANFAWYAPQAAWDIAQAGAQAAGGENYWDALGNELTDTWNRALDNDFVNYLGKVESTGTWNPWDINAGGLLRSQDYYKNKGIQANPILRKYGEDNTLLATSTLYDIVPVTGYMIGSTFGAKGFNIIGNAMRGISGAAKTASIASKIGQVTSEGLPALGYGALSRGTQLASKFLGGAATFVDATAPAMATAGMDYGYAKNNYDQAMEQANQYVNSPEFAELVNSRINNEGKRQAVEGQDKHIDSSLEDKVFFELQNPQFAAAAEQLKKEHNSQISDAETPWDTVDAAREMILKPYKDEYLNETKNIATFNAGLTFGLTILPDIHMTNTWRKAMFSSASRGAMNDMKATLRRWTGMKPKPVETYINDIKKVNGKWTIDGKPMTRKDLLKIYVDQSKAGFVSNYLQDVGVAAGQGLQEAMLDQYIQQRFGQDATDGVSYDMDQVLIASADHAGLAFGDKVSFRDGLYGALAPWIISPMRGVGDMAKGIKQAKERGAVDFAKSLVTETLFKNSLLYNATFGAKDIINKENTRRGMLHTTIENWMNTNGQNFMDNIGAFLELSKQEKAAEKADNYNAFQDSRIGQKVQTAIMLSQIQNFQPIKQTIMAYMKDRANRGEVNQSDIDRINDTAIALAAQLEGVPQDQRQEVLQQIMPDNISAQDRSIISDLIEIRRLSQDIKSKDSRPEYQQLNDLRENAQDILELIDKTSRYYSEAEAKFGDTADLVVKQEYARLRLYQDYLQKDVERKQKALKDIESKITLSEDEKSASSTVPTTDNMTMFISEFGGNKEKLLEGIEINRRNIEEVNNTISELKSDLNAAKAISPKNEQEENDKLVKINTLQSVLKVLEMQKSNYLQRKVALGQIEKDLNTEEENKQTPVIAAKDIMNLSEGARYALLTSKKLSKEQQAEVDKFIQNVQFANDSEVTGVDSYVDLLGAKLSNQNALLRTSIEGDLTPEAIQRLNQATEKARMQQAKDFYAKSFESFAEESQYHLEKQPNVQATQILNEETGNLDVVESVSESQPEISIAVNDQQAYENFVKAYNNKLKEIEADENATNLKLGLDQALKAANNSLYAKMQENQKQYVKAIQEVDKYVDPEVFNTEEKKELSSIIKFGTVVKSLPADNIMQSLTRQDDAFMSQLSQYLKDEGFNPGSIEDLKARLFQYNHNITKTIENNKKLEEERTKKKTQKPEVEVSVKEAAEKKFVNTVNSIATYLMAEQDTNRTPIRELLKSLGIKDADNIKNYSNNLLDVFKQIAEKSDGQNAEEMNRALDNQLNEVIDNPAKFGLLDSEIADITLLVETLKSEYSRKTGELKTYNITPPPPNNTTGGVLNRGISQTPNTGVPYTFADLSAHPDNPLQQIIINSKVDDFLRNFTVTPSTQLVFITSNQWATETANSINEQAAQAGKPDRGYNPHDVLPVFGAVEVVNPTETSIEVEGKHYQILGILPATYREKNTAIVRSNAISYAPTNNDPYVVKEAVQENGETVMKPLSTPIDSKQTTVTKDLDKGTEKVTLPSNILVSSNNFVVEEKDGKKQIRTNQVPSINKASTSRANWSYVEIGEMDVTTNDEGKTILEVEDATQFNSRTKGFAETLQNIIQIIQENVANPKGVLKSLNSDDSGSNTTLNSRIGDSKIKVALAQYISLANDFSYHIDPRSNGDIVLSVINRNKPIISWTIMSSTTEPATADQIIRDLSTLHQGDVKVGKWQVSIGNFDLSQKPSPLKVDYIKQAVNDGILYAQPVKAAFKVNITPVQDQLAKQRIAESNRQAEEAAAQAAVNATINPTTGQPENAGTDIESLQSLINSRANIDGEIKDKINRALQKIGLIRADIEERYKDSEKLGINQHKSRKSVTGTTSIINQGKPQGKVTKDLVAADVMGTVVDTAVRKFFDPAFVDGQGRSKATKEYFTELFKDVINENSVNNLIGALEALNQSFIQNGWKVISSGIYTIDEQLGNKRVGELDLLAIDAMGNFHIIDIKTYRSNEFELKNSFHNYPAQVSLYKADLGRNIGLFIPNENLHIFALKVDSNGDYYNMTTDSEGVSTLTKKPQKASTIQIAKDARFRQYDADYIGNTEVDRLVDLRRQSGLTAEAEVQQEGDIKTTESDENAEILDLQKKAAEEESMEGEDEAELLRLAQQQVDQTLTQNDFEANRSTDNLEDLGCK